jgi:threonine/homoserine/homoserine lactone efflux protein
MLEGITAGFILSLTLFPGTVWLAKVGLCGRAPQVIAVGLGFWCSQLIWLIVAIPGLMMMSRHLSFIGEAMHAFAAFVLAYMGVKFLRTRKADDLSHDAALPSSLTLFRNALNRSLAMPLRLPAAMAILLSTGVYLNNPATWRAVPLIMVGAALGVSWWWGKLVVLSLCFAKRVPERVTLKSLNKIRPFSAMVCFGLAVIVLFLGL